MNHSLQINGQIHYKPIHICTICWHRKIMSLSVYFPLNLSLRSYVIKDLLRWGSRFPSWSLRERPSLRRTQKIHKWSTVEVLYGFTQSFSIKQPCFYWFRMTSLQAVLSPPSPKHSLLRQVLMDKSTPQLVPQHSRRGTVPPSIWEVMLFNQRSTTILYTHTCARVPFTRPV